MLIHFIFYSHSRSRSSSRSTSPEFESRVEYITEFGGKKDEQIPIESTKGKISDAKSEKQVETYSSSRHVHRKTSHDRKHDHSKVRSHDRSGDHSRRRERRLSDRDSVRSSHNKHHHHKYRYRSPSPRRSSHGRHRWGSRDRHRSSTPRRSAHDHRLSRRRERTSYSRSHSRSRYNSGTNYHSFISTIPNSFPLISTPVFYFFFIIFFLLFFFCCFFPPSSNPSFIDW